MNHALLNTLMTQIKTLTLDEQRALNGMLVANLRHASKVKAIQASMNFELGAIVRFDAKTRGIVFAKVTGFSRDMSKVKCVQLNNTGARGIGTPWTASASGCRLATSEELIFNRLNPV